MTSLRSQGIGAKVGDAVDRGSQYAWRSQYKGLRGLYIQKLKSNYWANGKIVSE